MDLFSRKPRVIPTFGIRIKESLEELDFDPEIIAKFEFPETHPWTYPTGMGNLTLSYAKKDQTDPSKYISLHNEVKDVFRDFDFIYTYGSVSDDKAAVAAVIDNYSFIECLPDKSSIFSGELHALYLALDKVETADDDENNFIIFSDSKSALQAISGQDWTHPRPLHTGTPPLASTVPREKNFILLDSQSYWHYPANKKHLCYVYKMFTQYL